MAARRFVRKSANDAGWRAVELAANQRGGTSQLVGDGFKTGLQSVAMRIAAAAIIAQRFDPRARDGRRYR